VKWRDGRLNSVLDAVQRLACVGVVRRKGLLRFPCRCSPIIGRECSGSPSLQLPSADPARRLRRRRGCSSMRRQDRSRQRPSRARPAALRLARAAGLASKRQSSRVSRFGALCRALLCWRCSTRSSDLFDPPGT